MVDGPGAACFFDSLSWQIAVFPVFIAESLAFVIESPNAALLTKLTQGQAEILENSQHRQTPSRMDS